MPNLKSIVLVNALALILAATVPAQETPSPLITNTGRATIYVPTTSADFLLSLQTSGETFQSALEQLGTFRETLRAALADRELKPTDINYSPPLIKDVSCKQIGLTARIIFPVAVWAAQEDSARAFARICDEMAALGAQLGVVVTGPFYETDDEETVTGSAVTAAVEQAYASAATAAATLHSSVYAVDTIEILSTEWNKNAEGEERLPNFREVSCTATVKVTYLLTPPMP